MTAAEVIRLLDLQPHPEGGWYRETFRDAAGPDGRARSTAIYYLLEAGQRSHWHRVDAVETWHFYGGAPLALHFAPPGGAAETFTLGANLAAGERPQIVVLDGWWQAAQSLGAYTLVGCTVAPGFTFSGFELAAEGWEPR
jgi:predicted cupin superfamily sugar epimerase